MLEVAAFPGEATAYREYPVLVSDGTSASIAFTLGNVENGSASAAIARELEAVAVGLVSLSDYPNAPPHPLYWVQTPTAFGIVVAEQDEQLSHDVQRVIRLYARAFFADIAAIVPVLSALHERLATRLLH